MATRGRELDATADFLRGVGLVVHDIGQVPDDSFLPHVAIRRGELQATPRCPPSSLLHEAAHLAIVPQPYRKQLDGNLARGLHAMWESINRLDLDPDHPLVRAALQASDPEATAWAWAAGCAIGLPATSIILDSEYDGTGAAIREMLQTRMYVGIHGLMHAGMCLHPRRPNGYPRLLRWLQPDLCPLHVLPGNPAP